MNREFEVDSGSKASNIGRSGSYLLVRVPRHGAGQSDPCQNDVEKRHGENADAISPFHVLCAFLVFLRLPRWWNYRKWAWSRWNSNTFVRFRCHVAEKLWIKDWFSSRGWRSPSGVPLRSNITTFTSSLTRISSKYVILVNQLPDRASSALISTIHISLSWICITGNRPSSTFGYPVIPVSAGI